MAVRLFWCIFGLICISSVQWTSACSGNGARKHVKQYVYHPDSVCTSEACQRSAEQIISRLDRDVDPCEDFYQFACGGYINKTTIPDDKPIIAGDFQMLDQIHEQIKQSMEEESPPDELNAFKLAKKFYRACMNEAAMEKNGLNPLRDLINRLGGWPVVEGDNWAEESFSWINMLYNMNEENLVDNYLLSLNFATDVTKTNDKLHLIMNTPEYVLKENYENLETYYNVVAQIAVRLGADESRAKKDLKEALSFKIALRSVPHEPAVKMSVAKLTETYVTIPWKEYFQQMLSDGILDKNAVIFVHPKSISNLEKVVSQTSKRVLANYLMAEITLELIPNFNNEVRQMYQNLNLKLIPGFFIKYPQRWAVCSADVFKYMSPSVFGLYVRKYYKQDTQQRVTELTEELERQFRILLENADWMDYDSRKKALDKLDAMTNQITYPDELWDDVKLEEYYEGLKIDENNYWQSQSNVRGLRKKIFKNLQGSAHYKSFIFIDGSKDVLVASYKVLANEIQILFGFIQARLTTSDVPKYLNYAYLGFLIGHEISHGFDNIGRLFDQNGNINFGMWSDATVDRYMKKTNCLTYQYNNYYVKEIGVYVDGVKTINENIADNVGMKVAYMAYRDWIRRIGPAKGLPGLPYSPNQLFWINAAGYLCSVERKAWTYKIHQSIYSPNKFRVIGPLLNMPEFAEDFNCPSSSKMNPSNKCTVW